MKFIKYNLTNKESNFLKTTWYLQLLNPHHKYYLSLAIKRTAKLSYQSIWPNVQKRKNKR